VLANIYDLLPKRFMRFSFIYKYMLRSNDWNQDDRMAWVTHMFIHGNYKHLFTNLVGIWTSAVPIYTQLGSWAVYFAFFGGGIFAALPSSLQSAQLLRGEREIERSVDVLTRGSSLGAYVKPFLSGGARLLQMTTDTNVRCCGSSGAVCSLWGLSTVLLVDEALALVTHNRNDHEERRRIGNNLFSVASFIAYVLSEVTDVFGTSEKGFMDAVLGDQTPKIGHAAHLQGALFGSMIGLVVISLRRRRSNNTNSRKPIIHTNTNASRSIINM
jgi:membrane associated rhomboid family serine protease